MPSVDPSRRKRRRIIVWGCLGVIGVSFYLWQPIRVHLFSKSAPEMTLVQVEEVGLLEKGKRILIVAGHPDDSEFYLGGTLTRAHEAGAIVRLVAMTNGDKAFYPFGVPASLTATRQKEQSEAAAQWGGEAVFLNYRDGRLPVSEKTVKDLLNEIEKFKPDIVITFDPEFGPSRTHRDHDSAGENVVRALEQWNRDCWVLFFNTRAPNLSVEISDHWDQKVELLKIHKSQFNGGRLEFVSNLLFENAIIEGGKAGLNMAESFRAMRHVRHPLSIP